MAGEEFEDPAGVAGDGMPSGGTNPANGVLLYLPSWPGRSAPDSATCTLPANQQDVCTAVLNDFVGLYGWGPGVAREVSPDPGSVDDTHFEPTRAGRDDNAVIGALRLADRHRTHRSSPKTGRRQAHTPDLAIQPLGR